MTNKGVFNMIPPNLKSVVMPVCCGNCNQWYNGEDVCMKYLCITEYDNVCDSWDNIEYGN